MLKARRKEQVEPLKFPEPREGLPEDPRPFMGSHHLAAAAAVQEQLNARCLVAVVGRLGAGKSTVCRRAANSRWARQWFLQDENGQPVHRRFWADLEDATAGRDTEERVAHALGRPTFDAALARLGSGRPCLLILDNADQAFGDGDPGGTLARLVACVDRGASIVVTRRSLAGLDLAALDVGRQWTDIVDISGFVSHEESKQLFDQLAPRHASGLRTPEVVAACDRLPVAVNLLANTIAGTDIEAAHARIGAGTDRRSGLEFAVEVSAALLDPEDRHLWGALSMIPSGLSGDDITAVFPAIPDARKRTIGLFSNGVAQRCEAGVRIPRPLRLSGAAAGLGDIAVSDLWRSYLRRARAVVLPAPVAGTPAGTLAGTPAGTLAGTPAGTPEAAPEAVPEDEAEGAAGATTATSATSVRADQRGAGGPTGSALPADQHDTGAADAWLTRQAANLTLLASQQPLPGGIFELACAGLDIHGSGPAPDSLDRALVHLLEGSTAEFDPRDSPPRYEKVKGLAASLESQRRFGTSALVAAVLVQSHHRSGDGRGEAEALCQLGRCERFLGHYHEAETHLAEAGRHFQKLDDAIGQGTVLFELGQLDVETGRLDDAESRLGAALALFEANGRPVGAAHVSLELVRVDLARGRPDSAEHRLGDVLDRYEKAGDKLGFANACLQLGQVELARGRLDSAERRFLGALDGYEHAGDKVGFANAFLQLGQVELARGRLDSAERRFGGALAGFQQVGDQGGLADASLQLGQIDLARGRFENAGQRLMPALAAYEQLGDRIGVANVSLQLGQVDLGRGELEVADERLRGAWAAYDEIGDRMGSANSRHVAAMLRQAQNRRSEAIELFVEASRLYSTAGRTASAGWSLARAARSCADKTERARYAADAVRLLREAGLAESAGQLAVELAKPEPEHRADPATGPKPAPLAAAGGEREAESEPWPAVVPHPAPTTETPRGEEAGPLLEPVKRVVEPTAEGDRSHKDEEETDDEPDLLWAPLWSAGSETADSAPLDEWTSAWSRRRPDPIGPPVEGWDVALWGEHSAPGGSPADVDSLGQWSARDWGEGGTGEGSVGEWSLAHWSEAKGGFGVTDFSMSEDELTRWEPLVAETDPPPSAPVTADLAESELFPRQALDVEPAVEDSAPRPDLPRKARFRWSRRQEHQTDTPSLPGLED